MPRAQPLQPVIEQVVHKLQSLSPDRVSEVVDFIDFLSQRDPDSALSGMAMNASEPALKAVWDNADDAEYDNL